MRFVKCVFGRMTRDRPLSLTRAALTPWGLKMHVKTIEILGRVNPICCPMCVRRMRMSFLEVMHDIPSST
jgi:hypothetical protein